MSVQRLESRSLELDNQLSEEAWVPLVFVALEQLVRFLVGEEIEYQFAHRGIITDVVVENPCV